MEVRWLGLSNKAYLVLEDGTLFEGIGFGSENTSYGELVFNTSMTGYQEMLTDPSYAGQIVMPTYPIIGNYGINQEDIESNSIKVSGFVVRDHCISPSNSFSEMTLAEYLSVNDIPGISGIDTRSVTRKLRNKGVMMSVITRDSTPEKALARLSEMPNYEDIDYVSRISTDTTYMWNTSEDATSPTIVVSDYGVKYNIMRTLASLGCKVITVPANASAEHILSHSPQGIVMSPGPGDPSLLDYATKTTKELINTVPIMGICLGHQIIARAFGAETFKLKFGHRGSNHPVKDLRTGRVHITAQNHGYSVSKDKLPSGLEISHISLNDETVEGLVHRDFPIMTIQYHSEASPGPLDNMYLFERFLEMVKVGA
jgi:carbamoyl-phosphate synthase small subunit